MMTLAYIREQLDYDPSTGVLRWKTPRRGINVGEIAGSLCSNGYRIVRIDRTRFMEHRLVWFYVHGSHPAAEIDHINGQRADNRIANLREATRKQNAQNQPVRCDSSSGHRGVAWASRERRWVARVAIAGRRVCLGYFKTIDEASAAASAARTKLHTFSRAAA